MSRDVTTSHDIESRRILNSWVSDFMLRWTVQYFAYTFSEAGLRRPSGSSYRSIVMTSRESSKWHSVHGYIPSPLQDLNLYAEVFWIQIPWEHFYGTYFTRLRLCLLYWGVKCTTRKSMTARYLILNLNFFQLSELNCLGICLISSKTSSLIV